VIRLDTFHTEVLTVSDLQTEMIVKCHNGPILKLTSMAEQTLADNTVPRKTLTLIPKVIEV
jgi:hypothetical protein